MVDEEEQDDLKLPPGATLVSAGQSQNGDQQPKLPPGATLVHGAFPSEAAGRQATATGTTDTASALAHTQPGTETDLASRGRQIVDVESPYTTPLVSGRTMLNQTLHPFSMPTKMREVPGALLPQPDYSDATSIFDMGGPHYNADTFAGWRKSPSFLKQAATSMADAGSGLSSPASLSMAAAGGATELAPELGMITKPFMGGAGAGFGISGAKDIYDVTAGEESNRPPAERLEKGLMGGAQLLGGAAGLGETSVRGSLSRGMDVRAANEPFTPRQLYDTATQHGINLDLADVTNRPIAKAAKQAAMYGLAGGGPFERNLSRNLSALDDWGSGYLDSLSRRTGEGAGARIQEALKQDYEQRKAGASSKFEDLDRRVGPNSIDGKGTVQAVATQIRDSMQGYYQAHPELVPRQAWKIVNDLAEKGQYSWTELHSLRTDLMDIYRNNPEMIKSREQAWLQQMVRTIDDAMTGAASKLTPADQAQFRQANETWESLKSTYDNPAHPLYHAVRSQFPSKVAGSLLQNGTPEFARQLRTILGPEFGDLQRAAAESILGQDRGGAGYDFKGMQGRLSRIKPAYLNELFPAREAGMVTMADQLRELSKIGFTVTKDYNPSGSAKVGYKQAQLFTLGSAGVGALLGHPGALALPGGWLALERGVAGGMNSPRMTRFLTDTNRARALPRGLEIAAPAATDHSDFDQRAQEFLDRINRRRVEMAGPH